MTRYADPDVVEQRAEGWTNGQMACRLGRSHDWYSNAPTLVRQSIGVISVRQACGRNCGVARRAEMNPVSGHLLTRWRPDYTSARAKKYLLRDEESGMSVGRLDEECMARLRLIRWRNVAVVDVPNE